MSDEFSRIARLAARLRTESSDVLLGIGDDAAVLRAPTHNTVVTVDASVEGTHFRRNFASWRVIARRAIVAAASDLAAMGARPRAAVVAMTLPSDIDDNAFDELIDGSREAASELGAPIVGGNLAAGRELSIATTWLGDVKEQGLLRRGANVGDEIYVTGVLGSSSLGLTALLAGKHDDPRLQSAIERWRKPVARIEEGMSLVGAATSCIDVSDGLMQDVGHICQSSGVAARLDVTRLPRAAEHEAQAETLGVDALRATLSGGEDYELIFTLPPGRTAPTFATHIGFIERGAGVHLDGAPSGFTLTQTGYVHFR